MPAKRYTFCKNRRVYCGYSRASPTGCGTNSSNNGRLWSWSNRSLKHNLSSISPSKDHWYLCHEHWLQSWYWADEAGLAEPIFEHRHDWFVATLHSSAIIQDSDQDWLKQFHKYGLNERQLRALVHLKHDPSGVSNSEYRQINNLNEVGDDRKANLDLVKLTKVGIVVAVGANRNRRYILVAHS